MYLLFDIGGTKLRVARSRDGVSFDKYSVVPTPEKFEDGMRLFNEMGDTLREGQVVTGIAGGIAGPILPDHSGLGDARNLSGWARKPLRDTLKKLFEAPVFFDNDTAVVGLGEAHAGAGKGSKIMVYVTVSTGVGGVRVVDGSIDRSAFGFEPGHQIIEANALATLCSSCGEAGHLEGYISGKSLERRYGKPAHAITDPSVWEEVSRYLAIGLANTILHWSPDTLVLGGSMMNVPGIPLDRVEFYVKKYLTIFPALPKMKKAALGDLGGLHGGLQLIRAKMQG